MAVVIEPDLRRVMIPEEFVEVEAVLGGGIVIGAVEVVKGVKGGVIREVDGVGGGGIGGETRVFEHTAMEEEFEKGWICTEP